MIYGIIPLIIIGVILIGFYVYSYLKRISAYWNIDTNTKTLKIIFIVISIMFAFLSFNVWNIGAVVILHWMAAAIIMDLIHFVLKKKLKNNIPYIWKKIYGYGILPVIITILVITLGYWNMMHVVEKNYTVMTDKNIRIEGYRVALISDLHIGTTLNSEQLEEVCKRIEKTNPDFVILCGDITDESTKKDELDRGLAILSSISNKFGVYYVYGNHDRGTYRDTTDFTEAELNKALQKNGITILKDKTIDINGEITIAGREDKSVTRSSKRKSQTELLSKINKDNFILLADHQPVELAENDKNEIDLQVSGHTHGGQIFPVGILSDWLGFGELNYGYEKLEHLQVIVTSGIGGWGYPVRTGHHSEYVVIDIEKR